MHLAQTKKRDEAEVEMVLQRHVSEDGVQNAIAGGSHHAHHGSRHGAGNPLLGFMISQHNDATPGTIIAALIFGGQHRFLACHGTGIGAITPAGGAIQCTLMRWE
jgi:hypothetical protein